MGQQGSNTTFRVGGTARQAGGNWTGRFENPEGLNAWHSMYGSRLEPGDTVTVGDAILKWNGSAYKVIDGDFVDGPTASAWAAKFSPALASGSTATIAGVPSGYSGPGVGWVAQGAVAGAESFGMARFKAATKPRVFVYADSNGAGQGASNRNQAFPSVLASLLGWRDGAFFGYGRMGAGFDPRTVIGGFTASAAKDAPGSMVTCSGVSASDFQFSPGIQFDSFDFWHPVTASGNTQVIVKVDGVVVDTFSQSDVNALRKRSYSVSLGVHTISVQASGTGTAYIIGFETHDSTSLMPEICNCSIASANMSDLTTAANPWTNLRALQSFAPTAVILHCTINDLDNAVTPATLRGLIDAFVNTVSGYGIDQILTTSWAWSNSALSTDGTLDGISRYLKQSASAVNGAWADMRFAVGASGTQTAAHGWKYDAWHLNASGYARYAALLGALLAR